MLKYTGLNITVILSWSFLRSRTVHYSCVTERYSYVERYPIDYKLILLNLRGLTYLILNILCQKEFKLVLAIVVSEDFHQTNSEILR